MNKYLQQPTESSTQWSSFFRQCDQRFMNYWIQYLILHKKAHKLLDSDANNIENALKTAFDYGQEANFVRGANAFYSYLEDKGLYDVAQQYLVKARQTVYLSKDKNEMAYWLLNMGRQEAKKESYSKATEYFIEALQFIQEYESDVEKSTLIEILQNLGLSAIFLGEYEQASTYLQEGLTLAEEEEDVRIASAILNNLGLVEMNQGRYEQAQIYQEQSLALARTIDDASNIIISNFVNLGKIAYVQGKVEHANALWEQALEQAQTLNLKAYISLLYSNLAVVAMERGALNLAEMYFQKGITNARAIGDRQKLGYLLTNLVELESIRDNYIQAEAYASEGLTLAQQIGDRQVEAYLLILAGKIKIGTDEYELAKPYLQQGLAKATELGHKDDIALALLSLGQAFGKTGMNEEANYYFEKGLAVAREINQSAIIAVGLCLYGHFQLNLHYIERAQATFDEGLKLANKIEHAHSKGECLYGLAKVAFAQGDLLTARQQGEQSLEIFQTMGRQAFIKRVQAWLDEIDKSK